MKPSTLFVSSLLLVSTSAFAADKPASPRKDDGPYTTGLQLEAGTSLTFLGGEMVKTLPLTGLFANAEGRVGYYVSDHLGIFAGLRLGTGRTFAGCDACSALSVAVPVTAEWSPRDRLHGFHVGGGVSFLNLVRLSDEHDAFSVNDVMDLQASTGWRFQHDRTTSFDLQLLSSLGTFTGGDVSIPDRARALHYQLGVGFTYSFAP